LLSLLCHWTTSLAEEYSSQTDLVEAMQSSAKALDEWCLQ
jgi:hypothetical protein